MVSSGKPQRRGPPDPRRAALALVALACLAASPHPLAAQDRVSRSEVIAGQDLIYGGRFSAAHLFFGQLSQSRPLDPIGPALAASALIWWGEALDEERLLADSIDALLADAAARAEALVAAAPDDSSRATAYFWLGTAYGYRARQAELLGRNWRAAREAGRMRGALQNALALDSACVDCLLGLAAYEYGLGRASALARLVARIVGLGGGSVDRAMELFRTVVERGSITRVEGRWVYANVLLREARRDAALREQALRMVAELADEYPGNPAFRRFVTPPTASP